MNETVKKLWLDALRSGKYRQTKGALRRKGDDPAFCCLGVLCDLAVKEIDLPVIEHAIDGTTEYGTTSEDSYLPPEVMEWAGIADRDPDVGSRSLAVANDSGLSFEEIALLIENGL